MTKRVLVTGGRDYDDLASVVIALDKLLAEHGELVVIQGGATGADYYAIYWAKSTGTELITERAKWSEYGKAAGAIRNQRMIDEHRPDLVLAFEGGRGTADMVARAQIHKIPIIFAPRVRES